MSEGSTAPERFAEVATAGTTRERSGLALSVKQKSGVREVRPRFVLEEHEHYVEELWISRRLFEKIDFGPVIVDPCAGFGNILASAMACGLRGWGCDLVARAPWIAGGKDFLSPRWRAPRGLGRFAIVCNPPFGGRKPLIRAFAETALKRADRVAILMPTNRLNAAMAWLETMPLAQVLFVSPRSSLWPGRLYADRLKKGTPLKNGFSDCVWLIFEKGTPAGVSKMGLLRKNI